MRPWSTVTLRLGPAIEYCWPRERFRRGNRHRILARRWRAKPPRVVVGELHTLTHLVELPARGVGADLIGRAGALLVDIGIDTVPRGYRIAPGRSSVVRRAASLLDEDVDALEEAWERAGLRGGPRAVKVQAPGPITLAAQLELPGTVTARSPTGSGPRPRGQSRRGHCGTSRAARSPAGHPGRGAARRTLVARCAGRPASGVTSFSPVHPVDESFAIGLLDECVARVGGEVALHCCAAAFPWKMLGRSAIHAVSVDVSTLTPADLDGMGDFVESGRIVLLGVVPELHLARDPRQRRWPRRWST